MGFFDFLFGSKADGNEHPISPFPQREKGDIENTGDSFPKGVKGLQEVRTNYDNGNSICYCFPDNEQVRRLIDVASKINEFLIEAGSICKISLPQIDTLQCVVPGVDLPDFRDDGISYGFWGFCRVEYNPLSRTGKPNNTPVKCYIETNTNEEPGGISAVVWFDVNGNINKAKITCLGDDYWPWQGGTCLECTTLEIGTIRGNLILKKVINSDETISKLDTLYDYRNKPAGSSQQTEPESKTEEKNWVQLQDEGNELRKGALISKGVDLDQFDEMKCIDDAMFLLDSFIPSYSILGVDFSRFRSSVEYSNLTKAGNVPKNVVTEHVDLFGSQENDWIILHIKCLSDGTINMADIHLWRNHIRHGVSIRTKNGAYTITNIVKHDAKRDYLEPLFTGDSNTDPLKVLDRSLRSTWL